MKSILRAVKIACRAGLMVSCVVAAGGCGTSDSQTGSSQAHVTPRVEDDGTLHVRAFDLPESSFLSEETRAALKRQREEGNGWQQAEQACPPVDGAAMADMPAIRKCQADFYYTTPIYKRMRDRYPVAIASKEIGGVYTEIFSPKEGIAPKNAKRVLINLHGGAFRIGSRAFSHLESIPIASLGRIKVVSVDYRMWPEYTFPAASEDVAAVYRELLKTYEPKNIGMYGCSAGGALTAQSMAWFQKENLPLPGAIGMFCQAAERALDAEVSKYAQSDSGLYWAARGLEPVPPPYYRGTDRRNPLASPGGSDGIMAKFPPSLLIGSTRDMVLSTILVTHEQLTRLGVPSELHVWEGLDHAFLFDSALPESREAYAVIVKFFDSRLNP